MNPRVAQSFEYSLMNAPVESSSTDYDVMQTAFHSMQQAAAKRRVPFRRPDRRSFGRTVCPGAADQTRTRTMAIPALPGAVPCH